MGWAFVCSAVQSLELAFNAFMSETPPGSMARVRLRPLSWNRCNARPRRDHQSSNRKARTMPLCVYVYAYVRRYDPQISTECWRLELLYEGGMGQNAMYIYADVRESNEDDT